MFSYVQILYVFGRYLCACFNTCKIPVTELWAILYPEHSMRDSLNEQTFSPARPLGFFMLYLLMTCTFHLELALLQE